MIDEEEGCPFCVGDGYVVDGEGGESLCMGRRHPWVSGDQAWEEPEL